MALYDIYSGDRLKIAESIQRLRLQLCVHSYIYYELNTNIISDDTWNKWAKELVQLQKTYPEIADTVIYAEEFRDFDGSTGFDLPRNEKIQETAERLVEFVDFFEWKKEPEYITSVPKKPSKKKLF